MNFKQRIIFFVSIMFFASCSIQMQFDVGKDGKKLNKGVEIIVENSIIKTHKGWWIYGEGQHVFKDEKTLLEYDLEFPKENMQELHDLYLAICEMEYFPMECAMTGHIKKDILAKQNILVVTNFEILYIQGCGE